MTTESKPAETTASRGHRAVIEVIERALSGLDYGSLALTVHGGKVVQVDVTHRTRF